MTSVTPIASPSGGSTPTAPSPVTEQDFLQLLTAELQNQDPLQPVSGTQFLTQLAQFTELSAVTALQQQEAIVDGAALIGKTIANGQGQGVVQSAAVQNGQVTLQVQGLGAVPLSAVTQVLS